MLASEMDTRSATTVSCHFQSAPSEPVYFMLQMHAIIISLNLIVLTGIKWQQLQIQRKCKMVKLLCNLPFLRNITRIQPAESACHRWCRHSDSDLLQHVGKSANLHQPESDGAPTDHGGLEKGRLHQYRRLAIKFGHPEVEGVSGWPLWLYLQTPTAKDVWTCLNVVFGWA